MREPHPEIMKMIKDTRTAFEFCRYIEKRWPQFNTKTGIQYTDQFELRMASMAMHNLDFTYPHPLKGTKALLWRVAGDIFGKQKWYERGIIRGPNPAAPVPLAHRTITLECISLLAQEEYHPWFGFVKPPEFYMYVGYDAYTDTLFVNKGRSSV